MASASPQPEEHEHDQLNESGAEDNENEHTEEHNEEHAEGEEGSGENVPSAYYYYGQPSAQAGSPSATAGSGDASAYPNAAYWNGGYIGIPMHMPVAVPAGVGANGKPKRKQVKNACTNCQTACKRCDDERPCGRCVKYGLSDTCINSARKERKKGIKRGPYKKRKGEGDDMENLEESAAIPAIEGMMPGVHYPGTVPPGFDASTYYGYYGGYFGSAGHLVPAHGEGEEGEEGEEDGEGATAAAQHYPYMYQYYAQAQQAEEDGKDGEDGEGEDEDSPPAATVPKKGKKKVAEAPVEKGKRGKKRKAATPPAADDYEDED